MTSQSTRTLTEALSGRWVGSGWIARCLAHDDRNPSLSLSTGKDGKVLVYCHAGCDQRDVLAALKDRGLWGDMTPTRLQSGFKATVAPARRRAKS